MSRLLLTTGDPNGVGPELALKAVAELGAASPVIVGDARAITGPARQLGITLREARTGRAATAGVCDLVDVDVLRADEVAPGAVTPSAGAATVEYAKVAVELAMDGKYAGVVACPHSETAIHEAGIAFSGYPPLIAQLTGVPADHVFLMLVGGGLRVAHVTLHEPLTDAVARITAELVMACGLAVHSALTAQGHDHPRIGIFGINPHAGEDGLFGRDDERVTEPAARAMREQGLDVVGPVGADVLLGGERECHAYVAMYHDQGHIPVKTVAGRTSVAQTIGAGVPFCSVGHGPAFDIAGQGRADPSAVLSALDVLAPVR